MTLTVSRVALAEMLAGAARAAPEECCGILLGRGSRIERAIPTANVAEDRTRHFEIDPQALVDAHRAARVGGPQVIGYYHSHPGGPAAPSTTDREQAAHDGSVWAIVGEGGVAFWRDGEPGFAALSYEVEDG
jgi:proteasome lid subunit RPN8/RPN11